MITTMLNDKGVVIARLKVLRLLGEYGQIFKRLGRHASKQATVEIQDIPN